MCPTASCVSTRLPHHAVRSQLPGRVSTHWPQHFAHIAIDCDCVTRPGWSQGACRGCDGACGSSGRNFCSLPCARGRPKLVVEGLKGLDSKDITDLTKKLVL